MYFKNKTFLTLTMFFPVSTTLASFLTALSCLKLLRAFITHGYDLRQSALFYTTYCCRIAGDGRGLCNHLIRNSILDLFPPQLRQWNVALRKLHSYSGFLLTKFWNAWSSDFFNPSYLFLNHISALCHVSFGQLFEVWLPNPFLVWARAVHYVFFLHHALCNSAVLPEYLFRDPASLTFWSIEHHKIIFNLY